MDKLDAGNHGPLADRGSEESLRRRLQTLVQGDLLGPASGDGEELDESRVSDRYAVGMLAPLREVFDSERQDDLAQGGAGNTEDGATETDAIAVPSTLPSSLGLTFSVSTETASLWVSARWGRYERTASEHLETDKGNPKPVWKRSPMSGNIEVGLASGSFGPIELSSEQPEVRIRGRVREVAGQWIVSLFIVNEQEEAERSKDERWIFQVELEVASPKGDAIFLRRPLTRESEKRDPDLQRENAEMAMLYRRQVEFAVGHGVGVHADVSPQCPTRATRLITRAMPTYEVPQQTPPNADDPGFDQLEELVLDMGRLAAAPAGGFGKLLFPLVDAYASWIDSERKRIDDPAEDLESHRSAAEAALGRCDEAIRRIGLGIELLDKDESAAAAFRFANRAMQLQRIRGIYTEQIRRGERADLDAIGGDPRNYSWRPFQIAFVLLNLPSCTDLHHPERSHETEALADLLWFPTGGGKTEAYLGLSAYVMAIRRLQDPVEGRRGDHGVAVLMRYTLRLLTLQQFQRAATLICACESIRRDDPEKWGTVPFRIGLWVGKRATPNTTGQAEEAVKLARGSTAWKNSGGSGSVGSPLQLTNCPWCGCKLNLGSDVDVQSGRSKIDRTLVYCSDELGTCLFTRYQSPDEGLPLVTVDAELYRMLPSLVIATVDKFAQMPWNGRTQMLFGQVDSYCERHGFRSSGVDDSDRHPKAGNLPKAVSIPHPPLRPPDLIIQDELHLISGPLGSLVGLYETAIDELCSWVVDGKRVRPKLIASTATIRSALAQVHALFLRKVSIFPPPGTSIENNFFSIQRPPSEETPGRLYVGVCAPGKRLKALLIRTYVAYLTAAQKLYEEHGKAADPWMTLVGYFNSLRELGGMRRLVDDDVGTRGRRMSVRGLADRRVRYVEELTSRKSSTDIPYVLDRLEIDFDPADDEKRKELRKQGRPAHKPPPYDVMLATNMLSVGVDVKRLGLMVVAGQPKSTSEYIQATSRVGRHHPGIVCTVYNWARPRDLSHYERFEHYHATFYERVESLSVTPFAPRALDRGLSALLVSLARLPGPEFNGNEGAGKIDPQHNYLVRALEAIAARAASAKWDNEVGEDVRAMLQQRLDEWLARKGKSGEHLGYRGVNDGVTVPLLKQPGVDRWDTFTCLNSLRDVEPLAGFILVEDGVGQKNAEDED